MKKIALLLTFSLAFICTFAWAKDDKPKEDFSRCDTCHGLIPGGPVHNQPKGCEKCHLDSPLPVYNPGAHEEHKSLLCENCHPEGSSEPSHVDKVISLLPELGYPLGDSIPWPSQGGGSCGSPANHPMPPGCHEGKRDYTCVWIPGKNCKPPGAP